ncbi:MAG: hypothetical protein QOE86_1510 [Solirubrobacteraceae bacterium]|nr:hypothetical protein [Solirubrobacteraceae bacterium]
MSDQRSPEEIRAEIESTRDELADTAAALAYKADVKARAHDRVEEVKTEVRERVDGVKASVKDRAPDSTGGAVGSARSAAETAGTAVKANPVPSAGVAAALLGFAIGYRVARRRG